jgi:hypothetical protein
MGRIMPTKATCAGILKQSMGDRNRVGIGLLFRPAWLKRLAESILGLFESKNKKIRALQAQGNFSI